MHLLLTDAPKDTPLELVKMLHPNLEERLRRMGFVRGSRFSLLEEEVVLQPMRVRGTRGDVVIATGMAGKIIVHLDDGRKLPLAEMKPGESGHIEGRTGGGGLQKALDVLGFDIDGRITFVRRLPPMEFVTFITADNRRVKLPEGIAAKIIGESGGKLIQFCSAPTGQPFHVTDILGNKNAERTAGAFGITTGKVLVLERVEQGHNLYVGNRKAHYVIVTAEGLRLFLEHYQADKILVRILS